MSKRITRVIQWLGYISLAVLVICAAVSAEADHVARTVFHVGMINMLTLALLK
jgi:hypothetical protein